MRKQLDINKNRLFFSYFVITTYDPLNLIKNIIIDTVLQEDYNLGNNAGKKL